MKTCSIKNWLFSAILLLALAIIPSTWGQSDALVQPNPLTTNPEAQNLILSLLTMLAAKYPIVATLVTLMGTMRLWAKPLFSLIHAVVEVTPSKTDDTWWAKLQDFLTTTTTGKSMAFLLDWMTSIKLTPPAKKEGS